MILCAVVDIAPVLRHCHEDARRRAWSAHSRAHTRLMVGINAGAVNAARVAYIAPRPRILFQGETTRADATLHHRGRRSRWTPSAERRRTLLQIQTSQTD